LLLNHDAGAPSARLLGERSPIVDIEHYYLYSRDTLGRLVAAHGYEVVESGSVWNQYSVTYAAHLLPVGKAAKGQMQRFLEWSRLGRLQPKFPLGNLYVVAKKK
jgi:hypothetical protein